MVALVAAGYHSTSQVTKLPMGCCVATAKGFLSYYDNAFSYIFSEHQVRLQD